MDASSLFAVFVLAPVGIGYAATTRPYSNQIGLPGGKVDANETPREALLRECLEEGFVVYGLEQESFFSQMVEGRLVAYYRAERCEILQDFKEKGRIQPLVVSLDEIRNSGLGNDLVAQHYSSGM